MPSFTKSHEGVIMSTTQRGTKHMLVCGAAMLLAACSHSSSGSFTNEEIRAAVAKRMGSVPSDFACKPDDAETVIFEKAKAKSGDESKDLADAVLDCTYSEDGLTQTEKLFASRNGKGVVYAIPFTDEMAAHVQRIASAPPQPPLPQPDMSIPDSAYVPLSNQNGAELTYLYAALSNKPIDYDKIAQQTSPQYAATSDTFQRRDMLNALKPKIDAAIEEAKQHRYFTYSVDNGSPGNYDLATKTFSSGGMYTWQSGPVIGTTAVTIDLTNVHTPGSFGPNPYPVADETEARAIQALIDKRSAIGVKVFFFAQADEDTSGHVIRSVVTRYQLVAPDGTVLHTQTMFKK